MSAWGRAAAGALLCAAIAPRLLPASRLQAQTPDAPSFTIHLASTHAALRPRLDLAARESLVLFSEWLGSPPDAIVIADAPQPSSARAVRVHPAWLQAPPAMEVESEVSFALALLWWPGATGLTTVKGAAWYLQSRAIARVFDLAYQRDGHHAESVRLFGGFYPITFPALRLDGPAAGLGRPRLDAAAGSGGPRLPAGVTAADVRVAHAFASLERLVGRPRLAGALRTAAASPVADDADLVGRLSAALGQDLQWLFGPALADTPPVNYALRALAVSACEPAPCVEVRVDVSRDGAIFSGQSAPRRGPFASGDALGIQVEFADGQTATARWDGRDDLRAFEFQGSSLPLRVRLDPDAVMLVDDNWLDQSRVIGGATNAPVAKWVARWLIWLQSAMLGYSGVV